MKFKCGKCGKVYKFEDFVKLERTQAVDDDPNYGNVAVCKCGYQFHKEGWHLITKLQKLDVVAIISTVFLELEYDSGYYYKTEIFTETLEGKNISCGYKDVYADKEDAEIGHQKAIKLINHEKYKLEGNNLIMEIGD